MGILKMLLYTSVALTIAASIILFAPGIPPVDIEPEGFEIVPPKNAEGWFASNTILDEAEVYYESLNGGTESVAVLDDNTVYTGDQTGTVVKVTGKQRAEQVGRLRYPCSVVPTDFKSSFGSKPVLCGWPLGMRIDKEGNIMAMDYFGGLTRIDVKTGNYDNIIPKSRPIQGKIGHVPEDFDIASDGTIYWTDGSTIGSFFDEMLGNPSGRLMKYDPKRRTNEVLLDDLWFSNGVSLSDDEEFLIVADTMRSRIIRYYLKGTKKGQSDTFVDGLPGYPDNIRSNGRGGFYVPLVVPWNDDFHLLSNRPTFRKFILRSRAIFLKLLGCIKHYLSDNPYLDIAEKYITENEPILRLNNLPNFTSIAELSKSGEIIGILNGKSGKISGVSHISVGKDYAFLTSPFVGKIWRVKLEVLRRMY